MTKVARLFEEEKLIAIAEAVEKERKQAKQEVEKERKQAKQVIEKERKQAKQQAIDTATELIKEGFQSEKIVKCVKNLTLEDVLKLQKKLNRKKQS